MVDAIRLNQCELRGLKTAWLETANPTALAPDAPILLFLHGYPDTAESWRPQLEEFGASYYCVAPFARGASPSSKSDDTERYGFSSIALDHLQLLHRIDPDKNRSVFIVGHDLGGIHAWNLAYLLGDRLCGLVIINSLAPAQISQRAKTPQQQVRSWYMYALSIPVISQAVLQRNPGWMLHAAYKKGGLLPALQPKIARSVSGVVEPSKQYRHLLKEALTTQQHPRILQTPVLVLWGKNDAFLRCVDAQEMELVSAKFTIRILEGNHWLHHECREEVHELMMEFFKSYGISRPQSVSA